MMTLPAPASRRALAVLRSPDRRSKWVVVLACSLKTPDPAIGARLAELHDAVPIVGARLRGEVWHPGTPPAIGRVQGEPLRAAGLLQGFHLENEPPLRVVIDAAGRRVALAGHHAALDGRSLVEIAVALLGGGLPSPAEAGVGGPPDSRLPRLHRLLGAADRVAPSDVRPDHESLVARTADVGGGSVTARLAAAAVDAAARRNRGLGHRWKRVSVSVGVGGPPGVGNVATYRRIEISNERDVVAAVSKALSQAEEPRELVALPRSARLLAPFARRFSDSLLISNVGQVDMPNASRVEFYPVARGRSAVAFGAVGLVNGASTVSIRARDLSPGDAGDLLDDVVARLSARP